VVVGAAGDEVEPFLAEDIGHRACVLDDLSAVVLVCGGQRFLEADCLCGDGMHQRAALHAREDGLVDGGSILLAAHDGAAARPPQGLVRRRRHDVDDPDRGVVVSGRAEPGDVGYVGHAPGADAIRDLLERLEVDLARVGTRTADDDLRLHDPRHLLDDRVIERLRHGIDAVVKDRVPAPGDIDRRAVGEVAALGEALAHDPVLVVEIGKVDCLVCLASRMRLDVCVLRTEEFTHPVARQVLHDVMELATAVVALAGVPLSVLIGHDRTHRLENRLADDVLGGNQFQPIDLTQALFLDEACDFWIEVCQTRHAGKDCPGEVIFFLLHDSFMMAAYLVAAGYSSATSRIKCNHSSFRESIVILLRNYYQGLIRGRQWRKKMRGYGSLSENSLNARRRWRR